MNDIVLALVALYGGLSLFLLGLLVAKLDKAKSSAEHYREAYDTLKTVVDRFGLVSDMTAAVLRTTSVAAQQQHPPNDSRPVEVTS